MKFIKLDLLTLLIGLFLLSSCKDANTIGFELDPSLAVTGTLNNTVTVKAVTERDALTNTVSQPRHPLGFINDDPTFGSSESSISMAVSLPAEGYDFGKDVIVDSAVLVLPYQRSVVTGTSTVFNEFYGDTATSVYSFKVHQLKSNLALEKNFQSDREYAIETAPIGTFTAKISPNTPVKITDFVKGAADTMRTLVPELRIKLDKNFIQSKIVGLDSVTRASNLRFFAAFKGLQVKVDRSTSTGKGGMAFIDFGTGNANLNVYYRRNTTNTALDTLGISFPININTGTTNLAGPVAATIKHDYTGKPVQAQLDNPAGTYNVTYLQGMSGLRTKISFPDLAAFASTVKAGNPNAKIVINRAELVVNVSPGTDVAPFVPSRRLILYRNDIAGQRTNLIDYTNTTGNQKYVGSSQLVNGFYDSTNKRYMFLLTSYLQELLDGATEDYGTYLSITGADQSTFTPSILTAGRSVISTTTATGGQKAIQLNIYYTKVN